MYKINVNKDLYLNKFELYEFIYKIFVKNFNLEYKNIYLYIQCVELRKKCKISIEYCESSKLLPFDNSYINPYLKYECYKTFIIRDKNFNILYEKVY